jgi:hypothetical protein
MKKILYILIVLLTLFGCRAKRAAYISPKYSVDTISHGHFYGGDGVNPEYELLDIEEYVESEEEEYVSFGGDEYYDINYLIVESAAPLYNEGTLVYKVDSVLIIGVVSRVEARIIKQVSEETTEHLVSLTTHTTTGVIYEEVIRVGNIMDMDLKSLDPDAFTINKITDEYTFEWGGEGKVVIVIDGDVDITTDENIINNNKKYYEYKWVIVPKGKEKILPFRIMVIGDYEDEIILEYQLVVEKNIKESFNRFIDGAVKRWYWIFTTLLIPLFVYIRKKYFKKK